MARRYVKASHRPWAISHGLLDNHLLDLRLVVSGEAEHADASDVAGQADGVLRVGKLGGVDHAAQHVDHLEVTGAVDDEVAMVEEGEVLKHGLFFVVVHLAEHDLEARVVVVDAALEGVVVVGQHVGLDARDVVDQGEGAEVIVGALPAEGEVAVFLGSEVEGLVVLVAVAEIDGEVLVVVAEVDAAGSVTRAKLLGTVVLG